MAASTANAYVHPNGNSMQEGTREYPKKLVILRGFGHYDVFTPPALDLVMAEAIPWFWRYL